MAERCFCTSGRGREDSHERLNNRKGSYEPAIEKEKKEKAKMHIVCRARKVCRASKCP